MNCVQTCTSLDERYPTSMPHEDLGFSEENRSENIRQVAEGEMLFFEIHVSTRLSEYKRRDAKGLSRLASQLDYDN